MYVECVGVKWLALSFDYGDWQMAKNIKVTAKRSIFYKTYSFVDKDPIIYRVKDLIAGSGKSFKEVAAASGVSETTIVNWFMGAVRKPQYATLEAVCRSLGYTLEPMRRLGVSKPVDMSDGTVVKLKPKK